MRADTSRQRDSSITVMCRNLKTGQVFEKHFYAEYPAKEFVRKCRFSKKVAVLMDDACCRGINLYEEY